MRTERRVPVLVEKQIAQLDRQAQDRLRANVIAEVTSGPSQQLVLRNLGPANARNVTLEPIEDLPFAAPEPAEKLPAPELAPGEEVRLIWTTTMGDPLGFDVVLLWEDDTGPRERSVRLS